jgi:hypothetical protein
MAVGDASVGGNDGMADDLYCHQGVSLDIIAGVLHMYYTNSVTGSSRVQCQTISGILFGQLPQRLRY